MGINPATGKPFILPMELTQVNPGNKGIPTLDPATGKPYPGGASPQQLLDFHYRRAQYFYEHNDKNAGDIETQKAASIDAAIKEATQAQHYKEMYEAAMYGHDVSAANNLRTTETSASNNANTNNTRLTTTAMNNNASTLGRMIASGTTLQVAQEKIASDYQKQIDKDVADMQAASTKATLHGQPNPFPDIGVYKSALAQGITAVTKDPKQLDHWLNWVDQGGAAGKYTPSMIIQAKDYLRRAAQDATPPPPQAGGSNATGYPPMPNPQE